MGSSAKACSIASRASERAPALARRPDNNERSAGVSRPSASNRRTSLSASMSPILARRCACARKSSGLSGLTVILASNQWRRNGSSPRSMAMNSKASNTFELPGDDA